jgi:capsular polysaccharide biosynthesis protein
MVLYGDDMRALAGGRPPGGGRLRDMEIRDYLRIIRRRFWIVLLVPLVAATSVLFLSLGSPARYAATARVAARSLVGDPLSPYLSGNTTGFFVADFVATVQDPTVIDAAAAEVGVSAEAVAEGVSATPIATSAGQSALIEVRFETTEQSEAGPVAEAVAKEALRAIFEPNFLEADAEATPSPDGEGGGEEDVETNVEALDAMLNDPRVVSLHPTEKLSAAPELLRKLEIAIGVGLFLALFLVVLLEVVLTRRGPGVDGSGGDGLADLDGAVASRERARQHATEAS